MDTLFASPRLVLSFALGLTATNLIACGDSSKDQGASGGTAVSDAGSGPITIGSGIEAGRFNQCGVAAPLPADTGPCTAVVAPLLTNFDDYAGTDATRYVYYVNAKPPGAGAILGAILHVGDGSDADGTSVISTAMVMGEGDAGYALEIADTNAKNWGGLLMFYFPGAAGALPCLNAAGYSGIAFSIKGSAPSGRFGVSVSMLDTTPKASNGLCDNATMSDCKDATMQLPLATSADSWTEIQLPWSSFTPGVGSGQSCVPVTGQNIMRLVVQPLMNYPPPNYTFQPGPYSIAVDNVRFY